MSKRIHIMDQEFVLHPSGVVYWPQQKALLLADLHLGKVTHFRKNGAAIPLKAIDQNYRSLDRLLAQFEVSAVYFLGDLFHSHLNSEWARFDDWIAGCPAEVCLVEGNHDIISPHRYEQIGIRVVSEIGIDDFLLTHHPTQAQGMFNFCGHIHPGVRLQGLGRQNVKLACFYHRGNQLILPAFGSFTGKHIMRPKPDDHIYVIADNEVFLVT